MDNVTTDRGGCRANVRAQLGLGQKSPIADHALRNEVPRGLCLEERSEERTKRREDSAPLRAPSNSPALPLALHDTPFQLAFASPRFLPSYWLMLRHIPASFSLVSGSFLFPPYQPMTHASVVSDNWLYSDHGWLRVS